MLMLTLAFIIVYGILILGCLMVLVKYIIFGTTDAYYMKLNIYMRKKIILKDIVKLWKPI